jgi:hypothetical protein
MNKTNKKLRYLIVKYCYLCQKKKSDLDNEKIKILLGEIKNLCKY